jgi:UDP-N-acetylglucosamine acyltransferase
MANCASLAGHVVIESYAILGGLVAVHQWVRIGQHSFIGGGYRIPKDVPPFVRAAGEPLKPLGLNSIGLRRRGFTPETMNVLKKAYRILFRSDLNTTQALDRIREEVEPIPEIRTLVEFIDSSERGIIK